MSDAPVKRGRPLGAKDTKPRLKPGTKIKRPRIPGQPPKRGRPLGSRDSAPRVKRGCVPLDSSLEVASRTTIGAFASTTEPVAAALAVQPADQELVTVSGRGDKTPSGGKTGVCPSPTAMHNHDLRSPTKAPTRPFIGITTPSRAPAPRPQLFSMEDEAMHVNYARLQQMRDEELSLVLYAISLGKQRCLAALAIVTAKPGSASTIAEAPSKAAELQAAPKPMSPRRLGLGREGMAHGQQRSLAAASATSKAGSATNDVARLHVTDAPSRAEEPQAPASAPQAATSAAASAAAGAAASAAAGASMQIRPSRDLLQDSISPPRTQPIVLTGGPPVAASTSSALHYTTIVNNGGAMVYLDQSSRPVPNLGASAASSLSSSTRRTWSPAFKSSTKPTKPNEDRQYLHVAQAPKSFGPNAAQSSNSGSQPRQQALESDVSATAMLLVALSSTLDLFHVDPSELENSAQLAQTQTAAHTSRFRAGAWPERSRRFFLHFWLA